MIAKLKGVVDSVDADSADRRRQRRRLSGLGLGAHACATWWPAVRRRVLVETIVREDAIALYGFLETAERDWFRILTTVQGVGARVALSILSTLSPDEIARAIAAQDRASSAVPAGVGPKLAARLATELKDKAAAFGVAPLGARAPTAPAMPAGSINEDAVSALVNLGYRARRGLRRGGARDAAAGRRRASSMP